ncbi:hypothetical protein PS3A_43180 [Pseudomonas sp. 3A(2025)]
MLNERDELEVDKLQAELQKLNAEARKLNAESTKLKREAVYYPFVATSGIIMVVMSAAAFISKL